MKSRDVERFQPHAIVSPYANLINTVTLNIVNGYPNDNHIYDLGACINTPKLAIIITLKY